MKEYMKKKRSSPEFRLQENVQKKEHMIQKRSYPEFRQQEKLQQREHKTQKRSSPEFRLQENVQKKEHMTQKRSFILNSDNRKNCNRKRSIRHKNVHLLNSSPEFRQQEKLQQREHKTQKRRCDVFKINEQEREKYRKAQKRTSDDFRDEENAQKRARTQTSTYGNNLNDSINIFLDAVSQGPIYVCSSCLQTEFASNVVDVSTLRPGIHQSLLEECLTQETSIDGKEWLCLSCKREIYDGLVPKLSKKNKVGFPDKPPELDLNSLEEFFVAPLSGFMTIRSLPVCGLVTAGQKLMIGGVIYVTNDVGTTVRALPRPLNDMDTVAVKIKRKKAYKTAVFTENVRPKKVVQALEYLVKNSEMYKPYNIQIPEWLNDIENSTHDHRYFVEGKYPPVTEEEESILKDNDNVTDPQFEEVSSAEVTQGNMDTMLTENILNTPDVAENILNSTDVNHQMNTESDCDVSNRILTLAPGEGKIPVYGNPLAEYLIHPTIFAGQTRPSNVERIRNVNEHDLYRAELKHKDNRVWSNVACIFWRAKSKQVQLVKNKVTLAVRRVPGSKHQNITAATLLDPQQREHIRRQNDGYHIYKDIPNMPPYFEKLTREIRAMVRQLGNPAIFISLSSADTSWVPLQQCLGLQLDGEMYSEDFIKNEMTFEKKCKQVSSHPVASSRYFNHRVQKMLKYIIMGPHSPFGNVQDFVYRTEFQKRGSPHIHGLLWVKGAPVFGISPDEEICEYHDSIISCSLDVTEEEKPYVKLQTHKHSRSCKKVIRGKATCRFGVPWPPMQKTRILYPLETENVDEINVLKERYTSLMSNLDKLPEDVKTHESWLAYNGIDEDTYIRIIRSTLKRPKLFMKRKPSEHRVNAYMKGLLGVWQANHDVQFVLDPYQCVTYICDYMMKTQKGMSDLLRAASEEAKAGNMDIRQSVRHIGNKFLNAVEEPVQAACYSILQLPISNSSRKKEYINTSPPEERVGLTKSLAELEELKPNSKDVTYKSNIDRYTMRPKKLETWSLSDYVAKLDIVYPKKKENSHKERNDDNLDINELEDEDESVSYCDEGDFPLRMRNGIMLRRRSKNKVIRFRSYRQKGDPNKVKIIAERDSCYIFHGGKRKIFRENLVHMKKHTEHNMIKSKRK